MRLFSALKVFALYAVLFCGLTGGSVDAAEEINIESGGVAMHGYDPVAYHRDNRPAKGSASHAATHDDVVYWFETAENREAFLQSPDTYAPAYGGWCAYGVRVGRKFDTDPDAFRIINGRLYLYLDQGTQKVWEDDIARNIAIADRIWPSIRSTPASQLAE